MTDMPSPRPWHLCPLNHPDDDIQRVADALGDTVCWVELVNRDGAGNAALILAAAQEQSTPAEVVVHTSAQTATAVLGLMRRIQRKSHRVLDGLTGGPSPRRRRMWYRSRNYWLLRAHQLADVMRTDYIVRCQP